MRATIAIALTLLAVAGGFLGYWYLLPRTSAFGMFEAAGETHANRLLLSFAAVILGVVLGSFYRQLKRLQAQGKDSIDDAGAFVVQMFRSVDMWLGLVGSPIVYALLLQSANGMNLPGLLIVGLENGFCCLLLVNQFVSHQAAAPARGAGARAKRPAGGGG
jgi:hypothetical protein